MDDGTPRHDPSARTLSPAGRTRVSAEWARRLAVPAGTFGVPGTRVVAREDATAVVVVDLGGSCVVVCPPRVAGHLDGLTPAALLDVGSLAVALQPFRPRPIGAAALSYRDAAVTAPTVPTAPADAVVADVICRSLGAHEWDESGLAAMPHRWVVRTATGDDAALAGYERWGDDIAQLGVAAVPAHRGRGYAAAVAHRVVDAALDDGLVAQWRCRLGNKASERLAERIGFARVGQQTAVLVDDA